MDVLDAIWIAEKTVEYGGVFVNQLKKHSEGTISREEVEELFELPKFGSLVKEESGDNTTDEQ
jgi:hypothetical protein